MATLLSSPEIAPVTTTQSYGVLVGQGAPLSRSFTFQAFANPAAGPGCGATVQATLQLQDGANDLGQVSASVRLGTPSRPLLETFQEARLPALPSGWTTSASGADPPWKSTTNLPPNAVVVTAPPPQPPDLYQPVPAPPTYSAWTSAPAGVGQSFLYSPPFPVATTQAQLYFRHAFAVSNVYDGGILELAIGNQGFQELTQAGGSFVQYGYNGQLADNNPLGPRLVLLC